MREVRGLHKSAAHQSVGPGTAQGLWQWPTSGRVKTSRAMQNGGLLRAAHGMPRPAGVQPHAARRYPLSPLCPEPRPKQPIV